jgi:transcriptional regulator with XRE-family HTH domain/catechol 2,3-dioxygenase-like lactoylglutathione lyase family enzyme
MNHDGRPVGFHHFSSVVADLDRSVAFYSGLLGLEVRSRTRCEMGELRIAGTGLTWPGSGDGWSTEPVDVVLLELGGVRIELAQPLDPVALSTLPAGGDSGVNSAHVALKVDNIRELRRSLEERGVPFLTPLLVFPEEGHRPWIWCRCEDPDGYQVELVEEMPTSYQLERMAERLREARGQRGLTLKEVAAHSSISPAHLSQVERGETVPSVPTLLAISSSLGVSPDYFFRALSDEDLPGAARPAADRPVLAQGDERRSAPSSAETQARSQPAPYRVAAGLIEWEWLTGSNATVRLARGRFAVGAAASTATASFSGSASCAVLQGALLAEMGATQTILTPGGSISYNLSDPHRLSNTGTVPCLAMWGFCAEEPAGQADAAGARVQAP